MTAGVVIAAVVGSLIGAFWWLVEQRAAVQIRAPRLPVEPLHEAQHRVSDSGEREVRDV